MIFQTCDKDAGALRPKETTASLRKDHWLFAFSDLSSVDFVLQQSTLSSDQNPEFFIPERTWPDLPN